MQQETLKLISDANAANSSASTTPGSLVTPAVGVAGSETALQHTTAAVSQRALSRADFEYALGKTASSGDLLLLLVWYGVSS